MYKDVHPTRKLREEEEAKGRGIVCENVPLFVSTLYIKLQGGEVGPLLLMQRIRTPFSASMLGDSVTCNSGSKGSDIFWTPGTLVPPARRHRHINKNKP